MCVDPASGLLAGANIGLGLFGASRQASAARQAGQQQGFMALLNSQIAEANARMAMIEASGRMGQVDRRANMVMGANRADAAARGVDVNQGSPLLNEAFVAAQANVDKRLIAAQGLTEAASHYYRAMGESMQGGEALAAARYGAGTAWLGGLTSGVRSLGGLKWGAKVNNEAQTPGSFNLANLWS